VSYFQRCEIEKGIGLSEYAKSQSSTCSLNHDDGIISNFIIDPIPSFGEFHLREFFLILVLVLSLSRKSKCNKKNDNWVKLFHSEFNLQEYK